MAPSTEEKNQAEICSTGTTGKGREDEFKEKQANKLKTPES